MITYTHPNSSVDVPMLGEDAWRIYQAMTADRPMPRLHNHRRFVALDLEMIAERFRCEDYAAQLASHGVDALVGPDRDRGDFLYAPASIALMNIPGACLSILYVDSEFAHRLLDRLRSLDLTEAFQRTWDDAQHPTLSESAIRQLEQEADAHGRRVEFGDRLRQRGWTEAQIRESAPEAR